MKQKKCVFFIVSILLSLILSIQVYAVGDGNLDGGGGSMGQGTSQNSWSPGNEGVRVTVIRAESHDPVTRPIDLTNKHPNIAYSFGKVSKMSYTRGSALMIDTNPYEYVNPAQSLPRIISSKSLGQANIEQIKSYFTDEQVVRSIAGLTGMDFDTLVGGEYRLLLEPISFLKFQGTLIAVTATEAALYDEKDFSALDGIKGDKKFSSLSSFTASKESLQWVREYLSETLFYSRKCAKEQEKSGVLWGGWFQERDWKHWQAHMEKLIGRMDELLTREGETVALWTGSICQKVEPGKMAGKKEGEERENPHRSEEESMTFFERELKKMFGTGASFSEPRFVGNCCYGRLTDQIRVKINFQTGMVADHYDRLKVTLLNRNEGTIDSMVVKFGDVGSEKND